MNIISAIFILTTIPHVIKAKCCSEVNAIVAKCDPAVPTHQTLRMDGYCEWSFCRDGEALTPSSHYCGVGSCNIFGCNCDNGCRGEGNSWDDAVRLFQDRYDLEAKTDDSSQ